MKKIEPYKLWLGHAGDGRDFKQILDLSIEAIVQLAVEEPPLTPPRELVYLRFAVLDGTGNSSKLLRLAIECTAQLIAGSTPTLLCCSAGLSRSPAVAAAALSVLSQGKTSADDCLRDLSQQYSCDVSGALWEECQETTSMLIALQTSSKKEPL